MHELCSLNEPKNKVFYGSYKHKSYSISLDQLIEPDVCIQIYYKFDNIPNNNIS